MTRTTAADLINRSETDPARLGALIQPVPLDSVRILRAPWVMRRLWGKGISAMTMRKTVFIDPVAFGWPPARLVALLAHELVHVRQWSRLGGLRFLSSYLVQYLKGRLRGLGHRAAYLDIAYEQEARALAVSALEGQA